MEDCFHQSGAGRPPRKPLGLFKAHLVKRFLKIGSLRALERRLWSDERLRGICDIEADEPAYGRTVLSRFNQRLGTRKVRRLVDRQVKKLIHRRMIKHETVALDATFIKAYSRRAKDNRRGYSDPEAAVGRAYRVYGLGYKLHMSVDVSSGEPLTFTVAPANRNEKKYSLPLLKAAMKAAGAGIRQLTADSQYSVNRLRAYAQEEGIETAIPYPVNQKPNNTILRVRPDFKTDGPESLKCIYRKRSHIELVFARLKEHLNLAIHKVRGLEQVAIHVGYCILCLLYIVEASHNTNKPTKSRSITYWTN